MHLYKKWFFLNFGYTQSLERTQYLDECFFDF